MADIFVSYAQGDRDWVRELATALEAEGFSVWWDPNLLPGTKYRDAIRRELGEARAAIVVWSRLSVESDWVRDEAEDARQQGRLVPVLKEPVAPPHGFRQLQTANLSQWRGRRENPDFRSLVEGIHALARIAIPVPASPRPPPPLIYPAAPAPPSRWSYVVGIVVLLLVAGLAGFYMWQQTVLNIATASIQATVKAQQQQAALPSNPQHIAESLVGATIVDSYVDPRGAFLNIITPGGSASVSGLFSGDVIQAADGQPIRSAGAFVGMLVKHRAGDSLDLSVMHMGKPEQITLVLQPPSP